MSTWQNSQDVARRRIVLFNIMFQLNSRYGMDDKTVPRIARHAELALYAWANSRREYQNPHTLIKRLQALVIKSYAQQSLPWKCNVQWKSELGDHKTNNNNNNNKTSNKNKNNGNNHFYNNSNNNINYYQRDCKRHKEKHNDYLDRRFLVEGHQDITSQIYSFVDTIVVLRHRAVSKHANSWLPLCIKTLRIPNRYLAQLDPSEAQCYLSSFTNLSSLWLFTENSFQENHLIPSNFEDCGNKALRFLVSSLHYFPKLKELHIRSSFCDNFTDVITGSIVDILISGVCRELEVLDLQGNCIADYGAQHICRLIESQSCQKLHSIDLQHNFIGERGSILLYDVVREDKKCQINVLSLSNNLLQGISFKDFTDLLEKDNRRRGIEPLSYSNPTNDCTRNIAQQTVRQSDI